MPKSPVEFTEASRIVEGDVAVYLVFRNGFQIDVYTRQHAHAGKTGVVGGYIVLVIQLAGPQDIQVLQHGRANLELLWVGNANLPYGEFLMLFGR